MATEKRLIDANALVERLNKSHEYHARNCREEVLLYRDIRIIGEQPTVDAVEVTADELKHLINDTIAYIWRLEERGCDTPEFGYDSRKALLEKLKRFEKEHFPQHECCMEE